jgi:hypothetical protein
MPHTEAMGDALRRAAAIVRDEVMPRLNTAASNCGSCGLRHYEDFKQAQAATQLQGVVQKLTRWATSLEQDAVAAPDDEGGDDSDEITVREVRRV